MWVEGLTAALGFVSAAAPAAGAGGTDALQDSIVALAQQDYSPVVRTFLFLTLLSFVPLLLIALTSFTRIVIVLSLVRHALGLQQTPPNSVVVTLAVFLTLFTMAPVIEDVGNRAVQPYLQSEITTVDAMREAYVPLREFMVRQTRERDLEAVLAMANVPPPESIDEIQARHLIPAFLLSELRTAFQIGFVIFLPFLLIDLMVSAILMSLGMIMVPPVTVSLPLKILVFLLVDGWVLVSQALLGSFFT